jgi:hypothetical protein
MGISKLAKRLDPKHLRDPQTANKETTDCFPTHHTLLSKTNPRIAQTFAIPIPHIAKKDL